VRARWAAVALTGCVSLTTMPGSGVTPPFNACPEHACSAYIQPGASPICNGGACIVASTYSGLVLVVSLSEDSFFAPGQTIAIPYESLFAPAATTACSSESSPPCTHLPGYAIVQGAYTVTPQFQLSSSLDWNLGNPGQPTALPAHVTYRPLWQQAGAGSGPVDAESIGLPLALIPAFVVVETSPSSPPGPGQGPSIGFQANLQQALYEVTIQPDPPFDAAFPPEVRNVTLAMGTQNDEEALVPDITTVLGDPPMPGKQLPSFSVSRIPDGLAGWQAFLRDQTTRRRVSTLATLGTRTNDCASTPCKVLLPTNHSPPDGDALTNTELVLVPPSSAPIPTYVVRPIGGELAYSEPYPTLPTPMTVTGSVTDADGTTPVEAELFFQVVLLPPTGTTGATTTGIDVDQTSGGVALNTSNFEYTAQTNAFVDPNTGNATYSITLPPGQYTVTARPLDATHEITVVTAFQVDPTAGATSPHILVDALRPVTGSAEVADLRPMAGALVDAFPTGCSAGAPPYCMPRDAQTTTAADGSYALALDPGNYVLRVEPQDGTLFPWVTQAVLVGPTPVNVPLVVVPAPVHAGVELYDPYDNPVVAAVVRVFQVPATGPAVEVGRALTDATGTYDLYLAPSSP